MAATPTVRIEHDDLPEGIVIDADDFDPKKHVRHGEKKRETLTLGKDAQAKADRER